MRKFIAILFLSFRGTRKTECGAKPFLPRLMVRAAPFALCASLLLPAGTLTKSHSTGKFSDAEIEATIKSKLSKSKIGKEGFQVHVKDGVATWTGTTSIMQHKGAATRMAKAAGAIHVVNNIKLSEADGSKPAGSLNGAPRHVQVTPPAPAAKSQN